MVLFWEVNFIQLVSSAHWHLLFYVFKNYSEKYPTLFTALSKGAHVQRNLRISLLQSMVPENMNFWQIHPKHGVILLSKNKLTASLYFTRYGRYYKNIIILLTYRSSSILLTGLKKWYRANIITRWVNRSQDTN